jgi:hypothetical protein
LVDLKPTKMQAGIAGFFIFLIAYLLFFNLLFVSQDNVRPIYVPGTLIFGFLGYLLTGYLYERYIR